MASSPTARSLQYAKRHGWPAQVVERWNPYAKVRHDLFGCIDLVVLHPEGIIGVQACAGSSHSARRKKALEQPHLHAWLEAGGLFEIWSWAKRGERGKAKRWTLRQDRIEKLEAWDFRILKVHGGTSTVEGRKENDA